MPPGALIIMVV